MGLLRLSLVVKNLPAWGIHVNPWLIHVNVWQKPLQYCKVISLQLVKKKKNLPADAGDERDMSLIAGSGRFPWNRKWQPTPVFLTGKLNGETWWATVHGAAKSWTWLSNLTHTNVPSQWIATRNRPSSNLQISTSVCVCVCWVSFPERDKLYTLHNIHLRQSLP